jgi:hypothetical protein
MIALKHFYSAKRLKNWPSLEESVDCLRKLFFTAGQGDLAGPDHFVYTQWGQ